VFNRQIGFALGLAAFVVAAAAALSFGERAGMDPETGRRIMQVIIGLVLVSYANLMPKQIGRHRNGPEAQRRAQATLRVGGWSFSLAGLAYAALWASAPLRVADVASMAVVAAAMLVTLAYAGWSFMACRRSSAAPVAG
jgi:peptidoglycan/LPS O-acetylase OafA/YrhL